MTKRRRLSLIGFGAGCYLVFLYLFFPFDVMITRAVEQATKTIPGFVLHYDRIEPGIIFDTQLKNVKLLKADASGATSPFLNFKEISVDPAYLSMLGGGLKVGIEASGASGSIDADIARDKDTFKVDLVLDGLSADIFPALKEVYHVELKGRLYGKAKLFWDPNKTTNSTGDIAIEFREFTLMPSKVQIPIPGGGGAIPIELPQIRLSGKGDSGLDATLNKGQMQIKRLEFAGEDFELTAEGRVSNLKRLQQMRFSLKGEFGFVSEEVAKQLALFLSFIDNQKNKEGRYPISISGGLDNPQVKVGKTKLWPIKT